MKKAPIIKVSGHHNDMQGWYEEKCRNALAELGYLADCLNRPEDAPEGWPDRRAEIDFHMGNITRMVLVMAHMSNGTRDYSGARQKEDMDRIVDGGHGGYQETMERMYASQGNK